eukprot:Hpha_TRINITY_DN30640_c0_g1::TRINITY_DN30640_c0_g1_i1::g.18262::m.18262
MAHLGYYDEETMGWPPPKIRVASLMKHPRQKPPPMIQVDSPDDSFRTRAQGVNPYDSFRVRPSPQNKSPKIQVEAPPALPTFDDLQADEIAKEFCYGGLRGQRISEREEQYNALKAKAQQLHPSVPVNEFLGLSREDALLMSRLREMDMADQKPRELTGRAEGFGVYVLRRSQRKEPWGLGWRRRRDGHFYVEDVHPGTPADEAQVIPGRLRALGGMAVSDVSSLTRATQAARDLLEMKVLISPDLGELADRLEAAPTGSSDYTRCALEMFGSALYAKVEEEAEDLGDKWVTAQRIAVDEELRLSPPPSSPPRHRKRMPGSNGPHRGNGGINQRSGFGGARGVPPGNGGANQRSGAGGAKGVVSPFVCLRGYSPPPPPEATLSPAPVPPSALPRPASFAQLRFARHREIPTGNMRVRSPQQRTNLGVAERIPRPHNKAGCTQSPGPPRLVRNLPSPNASLA